MSVLLNRLTHSAVATACLLACLGSPGCARWKTSDAWKRFASPGTGESQTTPGDETASADRAVFARSSDAEGRSIWVRTIGVRQVDSLQPATLAGSGNPQRPAWRWRYADLEELLARPPERRPDLHRFLRDEEPIVTANAAIALGRAGDDAGFTQLADAIYNATLPEPMRCAAIEALAALEGPSVVRVLDELIDQYGRPTSEGGAGYRDKLHAELIRGLARHVDPADDPRFLAALRSGEPDVRLVALEAFAVGRRGTLPELAVSRHEDSDARVRIAALRTMAKRRHGEAHKHLAAALGDSDIQVRLAVIGVLGDLEGAEARATLMTQLNAPIDRVRAAAVESLARLGARKAVLDAADDEKWRVRQAVAEALASYADRDGAAAARRLLDDSSTEVQKRVVKAVQSWPLPLAGPILLEAMGNPVFLTRKTAAEQLADQWPPADDFPVLGSAERRQSVLEDLRQRFRRQFASADGPAADAISDQAAASRITAGQLARAEQLVRQGDVEALADFGPDLVEVLQQLVFERHQVLPETIYRDVLPRHEPVFEVVERLGDSDVTERRRAAEQLVDLAAGRPLGGLALARLYGLVAAESDALIWRSLLMATSGDPSEPAIRLAFAAIGHGVPEVRRRACENLATCPQAGHSAALVPALEDPNYSVRVAAVRALGRSGGSRDIEPLRSLLSSTDEDLRLETAVALVRLGDRSGADELKRLSYSGDPQVRRRAAQVMGQLPQASFLPVLIRLLNDRVAVQRAALASLPKVAGFDASRAEAPDATGNGSPATTTERVGRWKQWYRRRGSSARDAGGRGQAPDMVDQRKVAPVQPVGTGQQFGQPQG